MPTSPLETAGAQIAPSSAAPLHTNEFFTGMWSNGSPFGPGPVPYLYQKFYSASRYDRLIGGTNAEITTRLTLARRPGCAIYNSQLFPPINRFFQWRGFIGTTERLRLMASCDDPSGATGGFVYEATGPNIKTLVQVKEIGAGRTSFVNVGNNLYWGDGKVTQMGVQSGLTWQPSTLYHAGDFIDDPNGNIQVAAGAETSTITKISVTTDLVNIFLSPNTPFAVPEPNVHVFLSGLTTYPALNGTNGLVNIISAAQISFGNPGLTPSAGQVAETGTLTTGSGISAPTAPVWATTPGAITFDNGVQWICKGPAAQPWGLPAPPQAPTVTQIPAPTTYPLWTANTFYAPLFVIGDSHGNLQKLTTEGTTGSSIPTWATTIGATTTDGSAVWTCLGPAAWQASHVYAAGDVIQVTFTYTITSTVDKKHYDPDTGQFVWGPVTVTVTTTSLSLFEAFQGGTSGATPPSWIDGVNTVTTETTGLVWTNLGPVTLWPGVTQALSLQSIVLDSNGYAEQIQKKGLSGPTPPAWAQQSGYTQETTPGDALWLNIGAVSPAHTKPWIWAYSGKNSVTEQVSTASPLSLPLTVGIDQLAVIQGAGLPFPPYDTIVLWRTLEGGSVLFEEAEFPNPGAGQNWVFTDTIPDAPSSTSSGLNTFIQAPVAHQNDPPPANFVPICYYLNRIWGFVGNILMHSNGPDQGAVAGVGDQSFDPQNQFQLPSLGVTLWPTTQGLVVFTNSDIWALLGQGTVDQNGNALSPFYLVNFQQAVGVATQDTFSVNGSTAYAMLSTSQVVSMDPGAGELEVGFPVGDIFDTYYDPQQAYVCWHQAKSQDTALFVGDGENFWLRMAAVAAPEQGNVWSPPATLAAPGKMKALASIEIMPGIKALVIGPSVDGSPILMRDLTKRTDNLIPYPANAYIAPIVIAQPGLTAGVQFVVTEEKIGGTALEVHMLFDEILNAPITTADYINLRNKTNDPPNLPRQLSVLAQRLWAAQDANSVVKCRFYSQAIKWAAEDFPNELYTNTVYGKLPEKARK